MVTPEAQGRTPLNTPYSTGVIPLAVNGTGVEWLKRGFLPLCHDISLCLSFNIGGSAEFMSCWHELLYGYSVIFNYILIHNIHLELFIRIIWQFLRFLHTGLVAFGIDWWTTRLVCDTKLDLLGLFWMGFKMLFGWKPVLQSVAHLSLLNWSFLFQLWCL